MYTQLNKKTSWVNDENYVLKKNEPGYDLKEKILKIGNGKDKWKDLRPAASYTTREGYDGSMAIINGPFQLEEQAVAEIVVQGETVARLFPGQQVTLHTAGELLQSDVEVTITNNLRPHIPEWDRTDFIITDEE